MYAFPPFSRALFCEYITTSRFEKLPNLYITNKRTYIRLPEEHVEKQFEKCKENMKRTFVPTQKYIIRHDVDINRIGLGLNMVVKGENSLDESCKKQGVTNDTRILDVYDKSYTVEETASRSWNILRMQSTDNYYESKLPLADYISVRRRSKVPLQYWKHYRADVNKPSMSVDEKFDSNKNQVCDKYKGVTNDIRILDVYDKNNKVEELSSRPCNILRMESNDNYNESKMTIDDYVTVTRRNEVPLQCWKKYRASVNKPSMPGDENIDSGINQDKYEGITNEVRILDIYDKNNKVEEISSRPCNILRMEIDNYYESKEPSTDSVPVRKRNEVHLQTWKHYRYNMNKPMSFEENIDSGANQVLIKYEASDCKCSFDNRDEKPKVITELENNESPEMRTLTKTKSNSSDEQFPLTKLLEIVRERSRSLDRAFKCNFEAMSVREVVQNSTKKPDCLEPSKLHPALFTRGPLCVLPQRDNETSDISSSNLPQPRMIKFTVRHSSGLIKDANVHATEIEPKEPCKETAIDQQNVTESKKGNENPLMKNLDK